MFGLFSTLYSFLVSPARRHSSGVWATHFTLLRRVVVLYSV